MGEHLKLFVVGEDTPDRTKWSIWSEWSLVVAHDAEEAIRLHGHGPSCELPMDKAEMLVTMPEPAWGEDI